MIHELTGQLASEMEARGSSFFLIKKIIFSFLFFRMGDEKRYTFLPEFALHVI